MGDEDKKRRAFHKKMTTILDQVNNHPTNPLDLLTATTLMERTKSFMISCEELHFQLISNCTDDTGIEVQEKAFEPIEAQYVELVSKLRGIIIELTPTTAAASSTSNGCGGSRSNLNVRLPAIELPTFDGNYADWTSFKDLFDATVDKNSQLAPSQKLQYLKAALQKEPASLVKSLTITDAHYQEAINILKERYDNKREIITSLISNLLTYKSINAENAGELQKLMDNTTEVTRALRVMNQPVDQWDSLLVVLHVNKLDAATKREWAIRQVGTTMPTFDEFKTFVTNHIRGLQATGSINTSTSTARTGRATIKSHHASSESTSQCSFCSGAHPHYKCQEFLSKTPSERSSLAKKAQLCFNCLHKDHRLKDCTSKFTCKKCHKKHHSLLHEDRRPVRDAPQQPRSYPAAPQTPSTEPSSSETLSSHHAVVEVKTLLKTAVVHVRCPLGTLHTIRIFLDGGSEGTLITEDCMKKLGLKRRWGKVKVGGVGQSSAGSSKGIATLTLQNRDDSTLAITVDAYIMESVTDFLPRVPMKNRRWAHLEGLHLADPQWYRPNEIDVLVGMDYYNEVLIEGLRKGPTHSPSAQNTIFGWVLSGKVEAQPTITFHHTTLCLDEIVRKFWEVEEPPKVRILTKEEKIVENHFLENYYRNEKGQFVVGVPFNKKRLELGASRAMAVKRWASVERRLLQNQSHYQQYQAFMMEYLELGHMEELQPGEPLEVIGKTYHLPHHHVINEGSSTTKLRVVFDGSAKTTSGISLNQAIYVGATLQDDLYDLLLRFRLNPIVIKGDITKMFRNFFLKKKDADYHRIVWRKAPDQPIRDFRLTTVTYGTGYAPNVSTRCLQQLATDCKDTHPLASAALKNNTYVDDVMASVKTTEEALQLYHQLTSAAATAGLQLRKWSTNDPTVLSAIPEEERETSVHSFDNEETIKALGVQWCPATDNFTFKCAKISVDKLTKRVLLSDLSRVFDPIGFLSCVRIRAKLQMQELWKLQIDWDDAATPEVRERWMEYQEEMKLIPLVKIPRQITPSESATYQLHCYSDSSTVAYGCVLYLRSVQPDGTITVRFVTSKTRVAPLKQITLPRLELMSACEMSVLTDHVKQTLAIECEVWCWCDSTITLKWIASSPRRWQTFVANRVSIIQQHTEVEWWRHVPGTQNPADLASRGVSVSEIINSTFWFNGPEWLLQPEFPIFPMNAAVGEVNLEEKKTHLVCYHTEVDTTIMNRFSSLTRLKRVTAHIFRIFYNSSKENKDRKRSGPLTVEELNHSLKFWIKRVQQQSFGEDMAQLKRNLKLPHKSKLHQLYPYLDADNLLRVGGRLQHAQMPEYRKHQLILPPESHLTDLIIDFQHRVSFHGGFQLTWATLQIHYWILHGRDRVRHHIRRCVTCRRHRMKTAEQLMGSLPSARVTPARPFLHVGVDYAGPFTLKNPIGRAPKTYKGYMCLLVCMVTKAIHLEAVSSLSTAAFIETMKRFVARRGLPSHIFSDCGTNFVGAEKELQRHLRSRQHQQQFNDELASQGIQFHFNTPASPHQGGLWEAGVKSAKFHLKRVMGSKVLTYEVFSTFLCQVEAILNSRPLYEMSSDPTDLTALTPGHFLIGEPLTAIPDVDLRDTQTSRLTLLQQQQQRLHHFWHRWSTEYLNTLQQRNKWKWEKDNVQVGDLVLIKEDSGVQNWRMGRVVEVLPGVDDKVRRVLLRTATGNSERPIVKLIPLLSENKLKK